MHQFIVHYRQDGRLGALTLAARGPLDAIIQVRASMAGLTDMTVEQAGGPHVR